MLYVSTIYLRLPPIYPSLGYAPLPPPPPPNQSELCFDRDPPAPPTRSQPPPPPTRQTATSLCSSDSRPPCYSHPEATPRPCKLFSHAQHSIKGTTVFKCYSHPEATPPPYKLFHHRQDSTRVELLPCATLTRKQNLSVQAFSTQAV
jgi:hypothetical protein